jgi:hypothetical protein
MWCRCSSYSIDVVQQHRKLKVCCVCISLYIVVLLLSSMFLCISSELRVLVCGCTSVYCLYYHSMSLYGARHTTKIIEHRFVLHILTACTIQCALHLCTCVILLPRCVRTKQSNYSEPLQKQPLQNSM